MSTIQDFKNAPVGSTATSPKGLIALKTGKIMFEWSVFDPRGVACDAHNSDEMEHFTLNPAAPTTAQEALDLAWELAHEVKEGQVIPEGTRYLEIHNTELREYVASENLKMTLGLVPIVRTLDPLPEPDPDWLDAPAVLAHTDNDDTRRVWTARRDEQWASTSHTYTRHWRDLRDVTPLYPKGQEA